MKNISVITFIFLLSLFFNSSLHAMEFSERSLKSQEITASLKSTLGNDIKVRVDNPYARGFNLTIDNIPLSIHSASEAKSLAAMLYEQLLPYTQANKVNIDSVYAYETSPGGGDWGVCYYQTKIGKYYLENSKSLGVTFETHSQRIIVYNGLIYDFQFPKGKVLTREEAEAIAFKEHSPDSVKINQNLKDTFIREKTWFSLKIYRLKTRQFYENVLAWEVEYFNNFKLYIDAYTGRIIWKGDSFVYLSSISTLK